MPAEPQATVVVVPREGFRLASAQLARLLQATTEPFRLVYVDGNAPPRVAAKLTRLVRGHGGTLVRSRRFLRPTTARNLGFREVETPYVVFLDNDVFVDPGWLDALVRCAEETSAGFVSPVICEGRHTPPVVHVAGGQNAVVVADDGRKWFDERYFHQLRPLPDVLAELPGPQPTRMLEFHAVLVRTEAVRELGGLDERCPTAFEHNDLALSLLERGHTGWVAPGSVVHYVTDRGGLPGNFRYRGLRWSRPWIEGSLHAFCDKWGLRRDDPAFEPDLRGLYKRRRFSIWYLRGFARRVAGDRGAATVERLQDWWIERVLIPRHDRPPSVRITHWPAAA